MCHFNPNQIADIHCKMITLQVQIEPHHGSATANLAMVLLATSEGTDHEPQLSSVSSESSGVFALTKVFFCAGEGGDTQQRLEVCHGISVPPV